MNYNEEFKRNILMKLRIRYTLVLFILRLKGNKMELVTIENLFMLFFGAIVIDFITGVLVAGKEGKLKSRTCSNGIFRTLGEFIVLTVFLCLDYLIPSISFMLSTFIAGFLFKEALSIIENLIRLDVYIPNSIKKMLEVGVEKIENKEIR